MQIASISTPVDGVVNKLTGKNYLDAATSPKVSFVSDSFTVDSDTKGKVMGQLTPIAKPTPRLSTWS